MTPTEQAADRVKALVDWMSGRTQRGDDDRSFTHHAADLTTLLSALTALQARVGELEGALKPFAALYEQIVADHGEDWLPLAAGPMRASLSYPVATAPIRWADFKDAAASLTPPLEQE